MNWSLRRWNAEVSSKIGLHTAITVIIFWMFPTNYNYLWNEGVWGGEMLKSSQFCSKGHVVWQKLAPGPQHIDSEIGEVPLKTDVAEGIFSSCWRTQEAWWAFIRNWEGGFFFSLSDESTPYGKAVWRSASKTLPSRINRGGSRRSCSLPLFSPSPRRNPSALTSSVATSALIKLEVFTLTWFIS